MMKKGNKTKGLVIWLTGLPCSGKTTISLEIEKYFQGKKLPFQRLDGDVVRENISKDLGFSKEDRNTNIERLSHVAKILADNGVTVTMAFVSPYHSMRKAARELIGDNFIEVYVKADIEKCIERDVKGMYAKAQRGEIKDFTGVQDPFEEPENPEIVVYTAKETIAESVGKVVNYVDEKYFPQIFREGFLESFVRRPDYIIVGAQKSGTSSLYKYLLQHPRVLGTKKKEIHFFDKNFHKGRGWYHSFFPSVKELLVARFVQRKIIGECTPYYMFNPFAVKRIFEYSRKIKIIVLLRNPTERAYSHYHHVKRNGCEPRSFRDAFTSGEDHMKSEENKMLHDNRYRSVFHRQKSYLQRGLYLSQLKNIFRYFPHDRVHIINSNEFFENPQKTVNDVYAFLGLEKFEGEYIPCNSAPHDTPQISSSDREFLDQYYKKHNTELYKYLGKNFNW